MQRTIDKTENRRQLQMAYNKTHGITPTGLNKSKEIILESTKVADGEYIEKGIKASQKPSEIVSVEKSSYKNEASLDLEIKAIKKAMEKAAKELEFIEAAGYRDKMRALQKLKKTF
tara:strand:+ start:33 stop:380 length:348 start_codon:yes stop_codon:yes gene_type:complete